MKGMQRERYAAGEVCSGKGMRRERHAAGEVCGGRGMYWKRKVPEETCSRGPVPGETCNGKTCMKGKG